jgi:glycosyltransferase involved in cell wall biosynthesis
MSQSVTVARYIGMTVLLLIRQLAIGGAERQLVSLACELKTRRIDVHVAVFYGGGVLESELIDCGIPIIFLNKSSRWDIFSFAWTFVRAVGTIRPTIIYSFLTGPNLCALIARIRFPKQIIFWGVRASADDHILRQNDWLVRLAFWVSIRFSRVPNSIITNSSKSRDTLVAFGVPSPQIVVVSNGVDTERFRRHIKKGLDFRASLGIDVSELLIGIVARIDPVKDHNTFISGAAIFLKEHPNTRFLVIGDGDPEYIKQLQSCSPARQLAKNLLWLGEQRDMVSVYNALNLNTLTSTSEGFPNSLLEAMACGIPCVSSNVGDVGLIVEDQKLLFPAGDILGLVESWRHALAIKSAPDLHYDDIVKRVIDNFSKEKMTEKTIEVFLAHTRERSMS